MFEAQTPLRLLDVTDGLSNTAMISESTLGDGPESATGATIPGSPQTVYAYAGFGTLLSDAACASATNWNNQHHRGFMWASGEMRCASYNHYYTPNSADLRLRDERGGERPHSLRIRRLPIRPQPPHRRRQPGPRRRLRPLRQQRHRTPRLAGLATRVRAAKSFRTRVD